MAKGREVVLRRTWPQRLAVLASVAVIVAAVASARTVETVTEIWEEFNRVVIVDTGQYGRQLLRTDTAPGEPVNFLLVGTDSALGLDPGDPVLHNREVDPTGRALADTIMLLRLDPVSGSAWVLSIPRDLWAEIPGAQDNRITSALYIGGAELLVATVTSMFDVEINHYMEMDLAGFRGVVDALGGIPVWFPNPARDPASGLGIDTAGCHVLTGEQALQYVRSRRYTEQIGGRWQITGGDDFTRIERQQDFLVLALDRAIGRGARNLSTMVDLLEAGAANVTLDQDLRPSELVALGQAFAEFNPDNLHRYRLDLYTLWWPDGTYQGEAAYVSSNQATLDVFRGLADSVRPSEVSLTLAGADSADLADADAVLAGQGFEILGAVASAEIPETVVLHGPDHRPAALSVARYLDPVPYVAAREGLDGVVVALGADYRGILFLFQEPLAEVEAKVAARGSPEVMPGESALAAPAAEGGSEGAEAPSSTVAATAEQAADSSQPAVTVAGRPPEGESCG